MRVAIVTGGLPPEVRTGVAAHVASLARALAQAGVDVEVFAPRAMGELPPLAQRREARPMEAPTRPVAGASEGGAGSQARPGSWAVTWCNAAPHERASREGERRLAEAFGAFLDRERPQVVHFEDLTGVGPDGVAEAKRRGLATVFVAHDFWPLHDARHLLLPDLAPFAAGDAEAEARGRLALEALKGLHGAKGLRGAARAQLGLSNGAALGTSQGYVLKDQLSGAVKARLHGLIHGDARPEGFEDELKDVRERQAAKRTALTSVDARFATSRELARRLSGLVGRAFAYRANGVNREALGAAIRAERQGPLRIGFLGAIEKQRGLHVLLEAVAGLEGLVELHVFGESTDSAYVARCRARAEALGTVWHGGYTAEELPAHLASLDAVCLPSLWCENAPLVVREAYAAGLPIVASDTEAMRESVPVGEDQATGILVPRGDVGALRSALRRLAEDGELRSRLGQRVRHLQGPLSKRSGQEAAEWLATYAQLVATAERRRMAPQVPPHAAAFARRVEALERLSTRELFERVTAGLGRLGSAVGVKLAAADLLSQAVARGSRTRDERAADARAIDWLRKSVAELAEARAKLETETRWREDRLAALGDRLGQFERRVQAREAELELLRAERDDHGSAREVLEEERERLRSLTSEREAELGALTTQMDEARQALRSLAEERDWLRDTLDRSSEELRWLREHVAGDVEDALTDREAIEMHFDQLCREQTALREHEEWLRTQVLETFEVLRAGGLLDEDGGDADEGGREAVEAFVERGREVFSRLLSELSWRRGEMDEARAAAAGVFRRMTGGDLAARVRSWAAPPPRESLAEAVSVAPSAGGSDLVQPAPRGPVPARPVDADVAEAVSEPVEGAAAAAEQEEGR